MHAARERQRVEHAAQRRDGTRRPWQALQLGIEKRDVERRVVNDELRTADELEQFIDDVGEARLLREEFVGDAVNLQRSPIDFAVRAQIPVKRPARLATIEHLDTTDLDDAMPGFGLQTSGFGIEDDLAHGLTANRFYKRIDHAALLLLGEIGMHRQADHSCGNGF